MVAHVLQVTADHPVQRVPYAREGEVRPLVGTGNSQKLAVAGLPVKYGRSVVSFTQFSTDGRLSCWVQLDEEVFAPVAIDHPKVSAMKLSTTCRFHLEGCSNVTGPTVRVDDAGDQPGRHPPESSGEGAILNHIDEVALDKKVQDH